MKIAIVSHSYQAIENRKNITALSKFATVRVILQDRWFDLSKNLRIPKELDSKYRVIKSINISRGQYVLLSASLGLRHFKPDIILVEYNPWSFMFIQCLIYRSIFSRNAKIICMIKKNTFIMKQTLFGKLKMLVARLTTGKVDYVLAGSNMVVKLLHDTFFVPTKKVSIVTHLGVDTELFSPRLANKSRNSIVIGYCGRFELYKGITDLIEAIKLIKKNSDDFDHIQLMITGAGSLTAGLTRDSAKLNWLEIYKEVPIYEIANFLNKLDIFVMPSRILEDHQEHDAHALMEAMSCGKACIGTRSGIIPELLGDGAGILIDPEVIGQLSNSLRVLIMNRKKREVLGKLARKKAEKEFSVEKVAKQKFEIFSKLIESQIP